MFAQAYSSHLQSSIALGLASLGRFTESPIGVSLLLSGWALQGPILKWAQAFLAWSVIFFWWELYGQPCINGKTHGLKAGFPEAHPSTVIQVKPLGPEGVVRGRVTEVKRLIQDGGLFGSMEGVPVWSQLV